MKLSACRRALRAMSILGLAVIFGGCRQELVTPGTRTLPAVSVRVIPVQAHGLTATEEVVGTVRAKVRAAVEARVAGRIETVLVAPGQVVKSGDPLATLDAREIKARLESASAVRDQAQRDLDRIARLVKEGAVTQADFDAAQARQRVSAAAVVEAETMLTHTQVVAPFSGVITRKLADAGDLATPGRPLFEIEDPAALRFEADVPEALLDRIQMGASLSIRVANLKTDALRGSVSEIAPIAEAASRTYLVKLDLPPLAGLRAGQFGRLAVPTGETSVPHVPQSAVVQRGQLEYVYVATNGQAQLRLVRTAKRLGSEVEIVSGANVGEAVVVDAGVPLLDGQPLQVLP